MIDEKRKILLFYASIGSGHLIAARSIAQAIAKQNPRIEVKMEDIFQKSGRLPILQELAAFIPNVLFPNLYTCVWKKGLLVWFYELLCAYSLMAISVRKHVDNFDPDLVICTHSFPCSVISKLKEKKPGIILFAVPTDQFVHPYWPIKNVDVFIAPNQLVKKELTKRGVKSSKIFTFGIPISVDLGIVKGDQLPDSKLKILVLAGSYRLGPYLTIQKRVRELIVFLSENQTKNLNWTFVFGKNRQLYNFAKKRLKNHRGVEVIGFSNKVPQLIINSHAVATKPGGLTVAESLALRKPLLLLSHGAGQEKANADFVLSAQLGFLLDNRQKIIDFIKKIEENPNILKEAIKSSEVQYLDSSLRIANLAIKFIR
jgi:processive 1,2-diacylglycerol beta-glucosyltransferase